MPSLFSTLFSAHTLLKIFDRVLGHDIYDLRTNQNNFSFFSPAGLLLLFAMVFVTGHAMGLTAALFCNVVDLISISDECTNTWLALKNLLIVVVISYLAALLLGKRYTLLKSTTAIMENACSLFILSCIFLIIFNMKTTAGDSGFKFVSDLARELLSTEGTTNNIIAVFVVALCTTLSSSMISIVRRFISLGRFNWGDEESTILALFYLIFTTASLALTFFEFSDQNQIAALANI